MRRAVVLWGLVLLLAANATPPASGLGGLVVTGAGSGATSLPNGSEACRDHPLSVQVVYYPDGTGALAFNYLGAEACPLRTGGMVLLGRVDYNLLASPPSADYVAACHGTEASGLLCQDGEGRAVQVGPYMGPGNAMWIRFTGGERSFEGSFVAA